MTPETRAPPAASLNANAVTALRDNLIGKASRGMRFVKRAVRGDLHRFKAYVELNEDSERGWRGTIEDGDVKRRTDRRSSGSRSGSSSNGRSRNSSPSEGSATWHAANQRALVAQTFEDKADVPEAQRVLSKQV